MRKAFSGFSWGVTSFNENALKQIKITLPITKTGRIDFDFMEAFIQEMEQARIQEMNAHLRASGFEDCELTKEERKVILSLKKKRISQFRIGDLYNKVDLKNKHFDKRKDTRQIPNTQFNLPLVNAKHGDNGIMYYGDPNVFDSIGMTIDIVQNGAIATGDVYPQPQCTGVLWDAYLIQASKHSDNVETLMYFAAAIRKSIKKKYTYDNKAYWAQVKNDLINLPITSSGEIDYHFMEQYIHAQQKIAIQRIKNWRDKEISTKRTFVEESLLVPLINKNQTVLYNLDEEKAPAMVADEVFIPGSLEVRLRNTKREELFAGELDLVLMYAISPSARTKTEKTGKIALGIKEEALSSETIKAIECIKYIMFHYWKNSEATPFALISSTRLVSKSEVPEDYIIRQEKDAKQFLLIEYDARNAAFLGDYNILKVQRKGSNRYMPFVCKIGNIK